MTRRVLLAAAGIALVLLLIWGATRLIERLVRPDGAPAPAALPAAPAPVGHIQATFFYGTSDGRQLAAVRRDVPLASDPRAQGRLIVEQQLQGAPAPYIPVIPAGTTLRGFYITDRGDAFVDLSPEASSAHPGGSFHELLTVQAIVQAVTSNLRSARRVQILIDGREVDSLAGHVDLRQPIEPDPSLVRR